MWLMLLIAIRVDFAAPRRLLIRRFRLCERPALAPLHTLRVAWLLAEDLMVELTTSSALPILIHSKPGESFFGAIACSMARGSVT